MPLRPKLVGWPEAAPGPPEPFDPQVASLLAGVYYPPLAMFVTLECERVNSECDSCCGLDRFPPSGFAVNIVQDNLDIADDCPCGTSDPIGIPILQQVGDTCVWYVEWESWVCPWHSDDPPPFGCNPDPPQHEALWAMISVTSECGPQYENGEYVSVLAYLPVYAWQRWVWVGNDQICCPECVYRYATFYSEHSPAMCNGGVSIPTGEQAPDDTDCWLVQAQADFSEVP